MTTIRGWDQMQLINLCSKYPYKRLHMHIYKTTYFTDGALDVSDDSTSLDIQKLDTDLGDVTGGPGSADDLLYSDVLGGI